MYFILDNSNHIFMHNDLSHRKILRQSDKSFIQFCIHKLEVKRSKLASGTTLKSKGKNSLLASRTLNFEFPINML